MKLRRKAAEPTGRQRLQRQEPAPTPRAYSYTARRTDETFNTGRRLTRDLKPAAKRLWRFWVHRFGLALLLVVLVVSAFNILSVSPHAQVLPLVSGEGNSFLHSRAEYQAAADKILSESAWNRNKITINTARVSAELVKQFPELASASVTLPLVAHRPVIYVEPVQPALILQASNGSYVLGTNGRALLGGSDAAANSLGLPLVHDQSGLTIKLNRQALSANDVSFIQAVTAQLSAKGYKVASMTLPSATRELDVSIDGKPYFVKFNLQSGTARQQSGTFLATISQLQKQNVTPGAYVDVRVDGRAYYK